MTDLTQIICSNGARKQRFIAQKYYTVQRKARVLNTKKPDNKKKSAGILVTENAGLHLKQIFEWRARKTESE